MGGITARLAIHQPPCYGATMQIPLYAVIGPCGAIGVSLEDTPAKFFSQVGDGPMVPCEKTQWNVQCDDSYAKERRNGEICLVSASHKPAVATPKDVIAWAVGELHGFAFVMH